MEQVKVVAGTSSGTSASDDGLGLKAKVITLDGKQERDIGWYVIEAMNRAQADGHGIDHVLAAAAYSIGAAIAQRGGVLLIDQPLREALPPLVRGYHDAQKMRQQS